jgi:hypothetical protein
MSKKNKRQAMRANVSTSATTRGSEFNPDYSTTKRELRRIGILAGTFIVILIVLAIFQNQIIALFIK